MCLRNGAILILLCCFNTLKLQGNEYRHLRQKPTTTQHKDNFKVSLNVAKGNSAQILCDVSLMQQEVKWIEWTRNNSTAPVVVKFVNYQPYIDPDFSNRLSVDRHGHLLINPVLVEDSAIYKCTTYILDNHIVTFAHGKGVELKVMSQSDINQAGTTHRIPLDFPALIDCNIDIPRQSPKTLLAYTWMKNNIDVTLDSRFTVLISGSMFIRTTIKDDGGIYECIARTMGDEVLPKVYRGVKVNLDILYPPTITMAKETVIVSLGGDIWLPCTSQGNPSLVSTMWLWNNRPLPETFQSIIFSNGTLCMKNVQTNYEGTFSCTPFNEVGSGKSATTTLKVEVLPVFTIFPPKTLTAKLGDNLAMVCRAAGSRMNWRKVNSTLPTFRTTSRGGSLLINNIQLEDSGIYECKARSVTSSASKFVDLLVISTPVPPVIRNVAMFSTSALVSWKPGHNGGSRQTIEIWYRRANSDDHHWRNIIRLSSRLTSYTIYDLEDRVSYLFSLRGVNDAGNGLFSDIFYAETTTLSSAYYREKHTEDSADQPLAPSDLRLNITEDGLFMSWSYSQTPRRPQVQFFIVEYRQLNTSFTWKAIGDPISWDKRQCFIDRSKLGLNTVYGFRMFSFGGQFSEPSHVIEENVLDSAIPSLKPPSDSNVIVLVVCIIAVICILSLILFILRFRNKRKGNKQITRIAKIERKHRFIPPFSSAESNLSDSDNDSCELKDVKLLSNLSPFVAERQENLGHARFKKLGRTKYDHQSLTLGDEYMQARAAVSFTNMSNARSKKPSLPPQDILPEHYAQNSNSREDMQPTAFKSGRLLPDYPELRDSYDQFCTISEHSSHEELEVKCNVKEVDILNDEIESAGPRGYNSKCCHHDHDILDDGVNLCKRRKKTILEETSDVHEKYQRWSMPEFTKLWYQTDDSDTESTITDQTDKEHHYLWDHLQSTEEPNKPFPKSQNSIGSACHDNTSPQQVVKPSCTNAKDEQQIAAAKYIGLVVMKESVSCPAIVSTPELQASLYATDYDSSGFCEESGICSVSPARSRVQSNTPGSENGHCAYWHDEPRLENDVVYAKNINELNETSLEANPSVCEVSMCASDSGYSGLSNGTGGSPERDEGPDTDEEMLGDKHMHDTVYKPELSKTLNHIQGKLGSLSDSDSDENNGISSENLPHDLQPYSTTEQNNSICSTPPEFHILAFPDVIIEKQLSQAKKDKRCTQLMEEFKFNKTSLNPPTTHNSLYRTYDI